MAIVRVVMILSMMTPASGGLRSRRLFGGSQYQEVRHDWTRRFQVTEKWTFLK